MSCPDSDPAAFVQALRAKSTDNSASGRLRVIKAQTLANFYNNNQPTNDFGGSAKPSNAETVLLREVGTYELSGACNYCNPCLPVCDLMDVYFFPFVITDPGDSSIPPLSFIEEQVSSGFGIDITFPTPPGYDPQWPAYFLFFPQECNMDTASAELITNSDGSLISNTQYYLGPYTVTPESFVSPQINFIVLYPTINLYPYTEGFSYIYNWTPFVTIANACSSSNYPGSFTCFLEGAPVSMADGTTKPIEEVKIGDTVLGAFGETNKVTALHQPYLGPSMVVNINGEHKSTSHHPHVSPDYGFYCVNPKMLTSATYGNKHTLILEDGTKITRCMEGMSSVEIQPLVVGTQLQTVTGPRTVNTIESVKMSPFTKVYHLVVDGSHTYNVEGYAVTGWATDKDFNYKTWTPK